MIINEINIIKYGKKFLKIINDGNGELKMHEKIRLFDGDLPIEKIIIMEIIIVLISRLLIKKMHLV